MRVAERLAGVVEYLEDPTPGIAGMAAGRGPHRRAAGDQHVRDRVRAPAARRSAPDAVQIVLSDHHLWGGLRRSALLAGIADTFGLGLSMHSNSHLGISLAAMTHLAAATPEPHLRLRHPLPVEDRGRRSSPGVLDFVDGSVRRADRRRVWASSSTGTCSASCTSSTSRAACAGARTPSTCAASSRTSAEHQPLVSAPVAA